MRARSSHLSLLLAACAACSFVHEERRTFTIDAREPGFELSPDAAILFFVDGVDTLVMDAMLARGELPNVQRHFVEEGVRVRHAVTSVPSVTFANAASMATGPLLIFKPIRVPELIASPMSELPIVNC
jgi:hypothetical protein